MVVSVDSLTGVFRGVGWLYRHQQLLMVVPPWAREEASGDNGTISGEEMHVLQTGIRRL